MKFESHSGSGPAGLAPTRYFPLLLLLFVGSGCSALIYEVVWLQMLQFVIGSSAVSLGVLLGTFMGGMCLGSLMLPRLVSPWRHPLLVYAALELAIGGLGILLLYGMPYVSHLYLSGVGYGMPNVLLRGLACVVCLLLPTILMGATLPAIARWMETTRQDISRLGFFYGSNIAGAVCGCLLAGFYLLRVYDMATATYVAATINVVVGLISLTIAAVVPHGVPAGLRPSASEPSTPGLWTAYVVIALSGLCSLGAQVVWTRQLSLLLGATVYTFSIILAVFLIGLGLGSSAGAALSRRIDDPRLGLGICQLLVVGAVAWAAYQLSASLPYWPIDVGLPMSLLVGFQLDMLRCLWAILPAAVLWGASFPLALAAVAGGGQDAGKLVGGVYAANTVGAVVGATAFSLSAIAWLGTQASQQAIMGLSAASALLMFGTLVGEAWRGRDRSEDFAPRGVLRAGRGTFRLLPVLSTAAALLLMLTVPATPRALIGYGRNLPTLYDPPEFIYAAEGMNASIAVSESSDGTRSFHVSGKVVASSEPQDMRLQRMLGHLSALVHSKPRTVLVVGCGAGVTAGSFIVHPTVERIVVCEIEPLIPLAATKYFGEQNYHLLDDPRVEVIYDDARHYLSTTSERFDIITSDPIHPWVKGAAALYSQEYFELCQQRLSDDGVVTQWVPLYETSKQAVQSAVGAFFATFPGGTVWSNDDQGEGYDIVLLAQSGKTTINADVLQARMAQSDHAAVLQSLRDVGMGSSLSLLMTYTGRAADLQPWLLGSEPNRDRTLRLQYLAGMGLNRYEADPIYQSMLIYRRYPDDLFPISGIYGQALKAVLQGEISAE